MKPEALTKTDSVTDFRNMFQASYKDTQMVLTEAALVSFLSWTLDKLFLGYCPKTILFKRSIILEEIYGAIRSW